MIYYQKPIQTVDPVFKLATPDKVKHKIISAPPLRGCIVYIHDRNPMKQRRPQVISAACVARVLIILPLTLQIPEMACCVAYVNNAFHYQTVD